MNYTDKDFDTTFLYLTAFLIVMCCIAAVAAPTEIKCHWSHCVVHKSQISLCGASEKGAPEDMLRSEKTNRGAGSLMMRECLISPTDKPEIDWTGTHGVFKNRDTER